jgi:hypothetical protein
MEDLDPIPEEVVSTFAACGPKAGDVFTGWVPEGYLPTDVYDSGIVGDVYDAGPPGDLYL